MRHAGTGRWTSLRAVLGAVLVGVLAAAVAWLRLGPVARGTAWAEDAGLFFREHLALGPLDSVAHPYAGYLHLVPRLVVDAAFLLPVEWYALAVSAMCCLLTGAVCAGVFVLARDVVPSRALRLVLAVVPVLLPTAPWEISGNAANLHTYGLFLAPWLFAHRVRTWSGGVVVAVVTVLVVGTEAQAVLFLPLLVLAWSGRPGSGGAQRHGGRWRALPVTVAALGAAAAQVVTALTTERASPAGSPTVSDVVSGWTLQTVGGLLRADVASVGRAVVADGWAVVAVPAVAVGAVVLLGAVVAVRDHRPRRAVLAVALTLGSGVVWTAALVANASANGRWSRSTPTTLVEATPSRYAAAAGLLLTAAVVVAAAALVDRAVRPLGARRGRTGGPIAVVLVAVGWSVVALVLTSWVVAFPAEAQRASGPVWQPQFSDAERACVRRPSASVRIDALPWATRVPCALVLGDD